GVPYSELVRIHKMLASVGISPNVIVATNNTIILDDKYQTFAAKIGDSYIVNYEFKNCYDHYKPQIIREIIRLVDKLHTLGYSFGGMTPDQLGYTIVDGKIKMVIMNLETIFARLIGKDNANVQQKMTITDMSYEDLILNDFIEPLKLLNYI